MTDEQPTPLSVDLVVETSAWPLCWTLAMASLALASLGTPLTALSKLSQALSSVLIVELAVPLAAVVTWLQSVCTWETADW